ncbi:MAG: BglG family transcription antiterminator LicT [Bacillus sp. (in: firmicutes)]
MKIKKVYNNNVVLAQRENETEMVVMGCGLAFQKKAGDTIDSGAVEKTFVLKNQNDYEVYEKLAELLKDVPVEYVELSDKIITFAKSVLPNKLDNYIYIALTDHISFAIARHKQGIEFKNVLLWEIKKFYKQEFAVALKALEMIEAEIGVHFEEDEAGFIAMHLVNSQASNENMASVVAVTKMVNSVLNIVKYHFQMDLDESSINYERFITHLRFFAMRFLRKERVDEERVDQFLYEQVERKYSEAFRCCQKIATYLESTLKWEISNDEKVFLTLHIHRVTNRQKWSHEKLEHTAAN